MIILDLSANTHKNNREYYRYIIDEIYKNCKKKVIIKNQLFLEAGKNIPQDRNMFLDMAVWTWKNYWIMTTASVFDRSSLYFLDTLKLPYKLPFIKIANNKNFYHLAFYTTKKIAISYENRYEEPFTNKNVIKLCCVSQYPANIAYYVDRFNEEQLRLGISDHTAGLELYHWAQPKVWEKHIKLKDSAGLDAGSFAITPEELRNI